MDGVGKEGEGVIPTIKDSLRNPDKERWESDRRLVRSTDTEKRREKTKALAGR